MARFLSNPKLLSSLIDGVSVSINRRGYAAASEGVIVGKRGRSGMVKAGEEMKNRASKKEASLETRYWAPDPVTGYYRPENGATEIDVAKLREKLLNKTTQH